MSHRSLWQRVVSVNYIPLKTTIYYLGGNPSVRIAIENLLGNTLAFCPLGFLLPMLLKRCNNYKSIFFISAGTSFLIEFIEEATYLGSGDIDDVILNVLGSLLGFAVYCLLKWLTKSKIRIAS